ncbi:MAG: alpha/beta hydrolase [Alphaproteobacteria bacterium]
MILKNSLYFIIAIYFVALLGIYIFQRNILYVPSPTYTPPQAANAPKEIRELAVKTDDGIDLKGWYAPATGNHLTVVFFHGNADSLRTAAFISAPYIAAGYGFLLAEYRGYSGMPGSPTEEGLYADARAYIRSLIASGVKAEDIVLFGHSLGTGVAVQMASEFHVRGLILLAPYLSIPKMAQLRFPIFPAEYLAKDRYENFKKIPTLHMPVLIANGGKDGVIPPSQGKQLFALANEPKQFLFIPDKGHNDMFDGDFTDESLKWLRTLSAPATISHKQ